MNRQQSGYCDLHTHSVYSDGTFTPTELIQAADALGISAIALTDHNTAKGLPEFLSAARSAQVNAVCGVEFSTDYCGRELHILALFVDERHFDSIGEIEQNMAREKQKSNRRLCNALIFDGYAIDLDAVYRKAKGGVNRAHIAADLVERGYVSSISEAFRTLISEQSGRYIPPKRYDALEMVDFICSIGAVSVLAHPLVSLSRDKLNDFLSAAKPHGLVAMETDYSLYDAQTTAYARKTAAKLGLLCSGGSDFHGSVKPDISLGSGWVELRVPDTYYSALRRAAEQLKA
ncbi:MAG: PHP domain-containing protein [Acutalibacteraceae bacterium]